MRKAGFLFSAVATIVLFFGVVSAQTTEFTYQGNLKDGANAANGNYDFEFALFDTLSGGTQLGSTLTRNTVAVANGIFSVSLDFGSQFPGANRFLEIRVRLAGQPGITTLTPRQTVNSAPYSIKSLNSDTATNATQLGSVAANQYVVTTDPRMTDARPPTIGSDNYIQNSTSQQTLSNFNISGTGTANILRAETQFNIGFGSILSNAGTDNLFAGIGAGFSNTTGNSNAFFGRRAGSDNTTGNNNAFLGFDAGLRNTTGSNNAFFGFNAGMNNTTASNNAFFGFGAGFENTTGTNNAFFGLYAGLGNTTASDNSFFGRNAGFSNATGVSNSFFGKSAGSSNTTGITNAFFGADAGSSNTAGNSNAFFGANAGISNTTGGANTFFGIRAGSGNTTGNNNSFIGRDTGDHNTTGTSNTIIGGFADVSAGNLTNATAIGSYAFVTQNNSLILGSINGVNAAAADTNVGIGTTAPAQRLHVNSTSGNAATLVQVPSSSFAQYQLKSGAANTWLIGTQDNFFNGAMLFRNGATDLFVILPTGEISMATLGAAGATALCFNALNQISTCSSSLRYKTNIGQFSSGMSFVRQLRPISFDWKDGGMKDVGFGAEDIAKIDPRFVTYNDKGEVEGVKYDRLSVVLVNAVKEQQTQIEKQQTLIEKQQDLIEQLEKRVERLEKK